MLSQVTLLNISLLLFFILNKTKLKGTIQFLLCSTPIYALFFLDIKVHSLIVKFSYFIPTVMLVGYIIVFAKSKINYLNLLSLLWAGYFVAANMSFMDVYVGFLFLILFKTFLIKRNASFSILLGMNFTIILLAGVNILIICLLQKSQLYSEGENLAQLFSHVGFVGFLYLMGAFGRFKLSELMNKNTDTSIDNLINNFINIFFIPLFISYHFSQHLGADFHVNELFLAVLVIVLGVLYYLEYTRVSGNLIDVMRHLLWHHVVVGCVLYLLFPSLIPLQYLSLYLFGLMVLYHYLPALLLKTNGLGEFILILIFSGTPLSPFFYMKYSFLIESKFNNIGLAALGVFIYLPLLYLPKLIKPSGHSYEI